jgi:hypothetical protein
MRDYSFLPKTKHKNNLEEVTTKPITLNGKKILCVCEQGNNRSVHLAFVLRYKGYDAIPIGLKTSSKKTQNLLFKWADIIISTEPIDNPKVILFEVKDEYPRPLNKDLLRLINQFVAENHL